MNAVQYPWLAARNRWRKKIERALRLSAAGNPKGEAITRAYLSENPDDPQMNYNLGVAIERRAVTREDRVEACEYYARAVRSPGCTRDTAGACLNNIGILCVKVDQIDAAIGAFERALLIDPECSASLVNLGDCQRGKGNFTVADKLYERALDINPDHPECRFARGMLAMMFGDLKRGFSEYEHRFQVPHFPTKPTVSDRPLWRGEDLS